MDATEMVALDSLLLQRLKEQLARRGGAPDLQHALQAAVEMWLAEQVKLQIGGDPASVRGYQWKSVFLPDGTLLRTNSYGEDRYARVCGPKIICEGRVVSPSRFANWSHRGTRNAWNDIYLRRPQDKFYMLASRLRAQLAQDMERVSAALPVASAAASAAVSSTSMATASSIAAAPGPLNAPSPSPIQSASTSPNLLADILLAVVAAVQSSEPVKSAFAALLPQPLAAPERDCSKGEGWDLPERRKFRFRLEDVAFS